MIRMPWRASTMILSRLSMGFAAALVVAFAACGPSTEDGTQVHVSTTDSGTPAPATRSDTTLVVTPPADTVTNTVIEHRTDTVVKVVPGSSDTARPAPKTPPASSVSSIERSRIDTWLHAHADSLNQFGDPKGTYYTGGTPLFDEATG